MNAVLFREHGGPEVLRYERVEEPTIGPTDILLRVRAIGCNYTDVWARRGLPSVRFTMPHVSGSDAAGEVVAVGDAVTDVRVGDAVVAHPAISCRVCAACTSGREYFCRHFKIWGFQTGPLDGAYAEYARIPAANAVAKPEGTTWAEAASIPLVLLTAWHMLVTRARIQPGHEVLVWGATSGVGVMAIQIAKLFEARVIAVAGTDEKLDRARSLGADEAINYRTQDVAAEVRRLTDTRGVDIVVEHTGAATWPASIRCLTWGGTLVTCGNTTGYEATTDLRFLFNKQLNLLGCHQGTKAELLAALRWVEAGRIRAVVGDTLPLRDAGRAHELIETGRKIGKLVLIPDVT